MLPVLRNRNPSQRSGDPFSLIRGDFEPMMDRLFDPDVWIGGISYPVDIWEDDDNLYVEAEMPGFRKDEVEITFENGVLNITAERKVDESTRHTEHLTERRHRKYVRRFTLPTLVDESRTKAHLEDGVLHLTLPKRAEVRPRRIALT